jgi:LuxR family maltose regulon positive regulatory protein
VPVPILATKLYPPASRRRIVLRPRLVERLNEGLAAGNKLTLVSAPAGSGKTTLVGEWVDGCGRAVAWLSLDEADSDPSRFLAYLIAALRTVEPGIGEGVLALLQTPQPPPPEVALTALLNDLTAIPNSVVLVLDDYHVLDARAVDEALAFLVEHLPPQLHLVVATREDPALPLARLRARGQLTELRGADLRFTPDEAAEFLTEVMHLDLSTNDVAALDARTEGWIAGLQLAAISLQGCSDTARFIESFAGSNRFVLDYLLQEVLSRQSPAFTRFLLATSILDRLSGPLCDAVTLDSKTPGQQTIEQLERANLFVVPLDDDRHWYRYHHLFRDLLAQRLAQAESQEEVDARHVRASQWYEDNGFDLEAFRHAAAGHDLERAERLIMGHGPSLQISDTFVSARAWVSSLPVETLDARPSLRIVYAQVLLARGRSAGFEETLAAAEATLDMRDDDEPTRDLLGQIAALRAILAFLQNRTDDFIVESKRAQELLRSDDLTRAFAAWASGYAHEVFGERAEAREAYSGALSMSRATGYRFGEMNASVGIARMQELDNELRLAAETYEDTIRRAADLPWSWISDAHLGLGRILYEWNDLDAAWELGSRSLELARHLQNTDRPIACQVLLARVKLAKGDLKEAGHILADAERAVRDGGFDREAPNVAGARVRFLLQRGELEEAAGVATGVNVPLALAHVRLAKADAEGTLAVLGPFRRHAEERGWADDRLRSLVVESLAHHAQGDTTRALALLEEALAMAEPEGFVRIFIDEGVPMARLLYEAQTNGIRPTYVRHLLAAFPATVPETRIAAVQGKDSRLAEPLSPRELEVLCLLADGLTNQEIAARLFLSLHTVKAHARTIYAKLGAGSRTQAAARARALGLLSPYDRPNT